MCPKGNGKDRHFQPGIVAGDELAPNDLPVPPNLAGEELSATDLAALESRWVNRQMAESAFLRRVDSWSGAQLVGRKSGDYAGIAIPYCAPGDRHVREYRLRRDHPDLEADSSGRLRVKQKYLSPPGRNNMLYLPPGCDATLLANTELPLIITEGEFKTLALWRLATVGVQSDPRFLPVWHLRSFQLARHGWQSHRTGWPATQCQRTDSRFGLDRLEGP
jgi:hypothetical protein